VAAKAESWSKVNSFKVFLGARSFGHHPVPCSKSGPPLQEKTILNLSEFHGRGALFLRNGTHTCTGDEAWTYFRGPDSYVYELWQTPRPIKGLPPHALKGAGQ
jgi:hypothetical protein